MRWATLVLMGCGSFPSDAQRSEPYEVSPEFGTRVFDLPDVMSGTIDTVHKNDTLFTAVWIASGLDDRYDAIEPGFQVWAIDPVDLSAEKLEPPTLVSPTFNFHVAFAAGQALLVETGETPAVYLFADDTWNFVEVPPAVAVADTSFFSLDRDRIWARTGDTLQLFNGTMWLTVPIAAGERLGPIARDRFRTVSSGPCTREWDVTTLQPGEATCANIGEAGILYDGINGTVDDFAVMTDAGPVAFTGGAWGPVVALASAPSGSYTNLGGPLTWAEPTIGAQEVGAVVQLDGGVASQALPGFSPAVACDCDRNVDATCACVSPQTEYTELVVGGDGSQVHVAVAVVANGDRALYLRNVTFPSQDPPFSGGTDTGY